MMNYKELKEWIKAGLLIKKLSFRKGETTYILDDGGYYRVVKTNKQRDIICDDSLEYQFVKKYL